MAMRKRGKMWVADLYDANGHRTVRKLSPYEETASQMYKDLIGLRDAEKNGTKIKDMTWFAFREKYLLHRKAMFNPATYGNDVRAFDRVAEYGRPLQYLSQMTPEYLEDFWTKCKTHKDKPLMDQTISGYVRRIKTAMHKARVWDLAPMQDWGKIKCLPDGKRTEYLNYPDFNRVIAACEGRYQRAAMLMVWAGLRRGEVLHLEWSDVDFRNHIITIQAKTKVVNGSEVVVWAPKGSKPRKPKNRTVDMTTKLETYLKALPDKTGLVLGGTPINEDVFTKYFRQLGKRLKVRLFPHKFRHTCGTYLASNGVGLKVVGSILGQTDRRSTDIYTHVMPRARRNGMDQMEQGMDQWGAESV